MGWEENRQRQVQKQIPFGNDRKKSKSNGKRRSSARMTTKDAKAKALTQKVFEGGGEVGFFVAVFDDDGGVDREAEGFAGFGLDGAAAGDDYSAAGDDERGFGGGFVNGVAGDVVDRGAAGKDDA